MLWQNCCCSPLDKKLSDSKTCRSQDLSFLEFNYTSGRTTSTIDKSTEKCSKDTGKQPVFYSKCYHKSFQEDEMRGASSLAFFKAALSRHEKTSLLWPSWHSDHTMSVVRSSYNLILAVHPWRAGIWVKRENTCMKGKRQGSLIKEKVTNELMK